MTKVGPRTAILLTLIAFLAIGCSAAAPSRPAPTPIRTPVAPTATPVASSTSTPAVSTTGWPGGYVLGDFPQMPRQPLGSGTAHLALQAVLDQAGEDGRVPGVTAMVIAADRGIWSGAVGTADGNTPMDAAAEFGIASLTKTVIAAEVMSLVDAGKLALADKVADRLPDDITFDANGATIENLLSMESGIPDPTISDSVVLAEPLRRWNPREVLATVPAQRSAPGDHFVYEDANYMLLGLVIEAATGTTVAKALRSGVLAEFPGLVYQPEEPPHGMLALPYRAGQTTASPAGGCCLESASESSWANGSGGMAGNASALGAFGYALFGGSLVGTASLRAMTDFGTGSVYDRYGLGVFDQTPLFSNLGTVSIGNAGWGQGYSSMLATLPSEGIVIAVLANRGANPVELALPIVEQLALIVRAQP